MFLLQKANGLSTLFTRAVLDVCIQKIMKYFARIHFTQDKPSLSRIRSLPLFCDINNQYQVLEHDAYIWPEIVPIVGSKKWLQDHAAIFLLDSGNWSQLGVSKALLEIKTLSPFSLYTNFIFPNFAKLTPDERISHLEHIRDTEQLFNTAYAISESKDMQGKHEAALFVAALQQLPCLTINGELYPLCEFCDPKKEMFKKFPENIIFPPQELQNDEWLGFFRKHRRH